MQSFHRKRRTPVASWTEPVRNGGPSMVAKAVAKELKLTIGRVNQLVDAGPEQDGLPGYINLSGEWTLKRGRGFPGVQVFFYQDDIVDWKRRHPLKSEREG